MVDKRTIKTVVRLGAGLMMGASVITAAKFGGSSSKNSNAIVVSYKVARGCGDDTANTPKEKKAKCMKAKRMGFNAFEAEFTAFMSADCPAKVDNLSTLALAEVAFQVKSGDLAGCVNELQKLHTVEMVEKLDNASPARQQRKLLVSTTPALVPDALRKRSLFELPNDPELPKQWALPAVNAIEAYEFFKNSGRTPSENVLVAIFGDGVMYDHPDLHDSMWVNHGEFGLDEDGKDKRTNGKDDDGNGYIDDVHGINFSKENEGQRDRNNIAGNGDPYPDADEQGDYSGQGTECAGILGATGNNEKGLAGVATMTPNEPSSPKVKIMAIRTTGALSILRGLDYAIKQGSRISNHGVDIDPKDLSAFKRLLRKVNRNDNDSMDHLLVGNANILPCHVDSSSILCVGASDLSSRGIQKLADSRDDVTSVDVAAPGWELLTTEPHKDVNGDVATTYGKQTGSSYASSLTAGMAAVVMSFADGAIGADEIADILFQTVEKSPAFREIKSGGTVDLLAAVQEAQKRLQRG